MHENGKPAKKKPEFRNWGIVVWILFLFFMVSFTTLMVYLTDTYFPDETLFILLMVIRYSSYIVIVCSVYKLLVSVFRMLRNPSLSRALKISFYLVCFGYGIAVILFESFIVVLSRGNG